MKQVLLFLMIGLSTGLASCQQGHKIEVEFQGITDNVLYLVHYYGNSNMIADTALREKSGKFVFSGKQNLPAGVYILVDESKSRPYFEFLLDDKQQFKVKTDTSAVHEKLTFINSPLNSEFRSYTQFINDKRKESDLFRQELGVLKEEDAIMNGARIKELEEKLKGFDGQVKAHQKVLVAKDPNSMLSVLIKMQWEPEQPYNLATGNREDSLNAFHYTREHYWDYVDLSDERIVRTPIFHEKLKTYFTVLVMQIPDSIIAEGERMIAKTVSSPDLYKFVVWYIVNMTERSNIMGMERAFVHFARQYYLAGKTWWASEAVLKQMAERVDVLDRILIGKVAPELQMWDTNRTVTSLHRVQAEYTILVFWDYECGHCAKLLPQVNTFYEEVKHEGVKVFAVCTKTDLDKWKKYLREKQYDWIHVNGGYSINRYDTLYDIISTPIIFLLDRDKKILAKKIEVDQLREIMHFEMGRNPNREGILRKD